MDYDDIFETAVSIVKEAGKVVREAIDKEKVTETKASAIDLVTETDRKVEELLVKRIKEKYQDHKFIGEESVSNGEQCEWSDSPTWIIDPIDGTMNFVHTFPYTCISVGFTVYKSTKIGIIYNPILDHLYTGREGKGAFFNGKKLQCSSETDLAKSLLVVEFGSSRDPVKMECTFHNLNILTPKVHGIRAMGSAALNLCMVAAGHAEAYLEFGIHCWDMCAGELIVREAGGVVMNTNGESFDLMSRRIICASSQQLAANIIKLIRQYEPGRD